MQYNFALIDVSFYRFANLLEYYIETQPLPVKYRRRMKDRSHTVELTLEDDIAPAIIFEAINLADQHIAIEATCRVPDAAEMFCQIMDKLRSYWPDRVPQVAPPTAAPRPPTTPPGRPVELTERDINLATATRIAEAMLHIERDKVSKSVACDLAGVARKTFNKWQTHPVVLEQLKTLREQDQRR
jgi:hypothetical protein